MRLLAGRLGVRRRPRRSRHRTRGNLRHRDPAPRRAKALIVKRRFDLGQETSSCDSSLHGENAQPVVLVKRQRFRG